MNIFIAGNVATQSPKLFTDLIKRSSLIKTQFLTFIYLFMFSLICKQVHAPSARLHFLLNSNLQRVLQRCSYILGGILISDHCHSYMNI